MRGSDALCIFLVFNFIPQTPDATCLLGKVPETIWSWPLSGWPWTPPRFVPLQTPLSPTSCTSPGSPVPWKLWVTPNCSFLKANSKICPLWRLLTPPHEGPWAASSEIVLWWLLDPHHILVSLLPSRLTLHPISNMPIGVLPPPPKSTQESEDNV